MRSAYKYLAYLVCALVMVQAASHAWVSSGLAKYLEGGGTIDFESESLPDFPEATGFVIHGMNGMMVIPAVALVLVVVAFLAKVPGGLAWAGGVLALVVLQVALGLMGHSVTIAAFVHGVNALLLFGVALIAGRRVDRVGTDASADARHTVSAV